MPVYQTREEKELWKKETYHSNIFAILSAGVKQKPVAVIVGDGAIFEITDQVEMKYPVDICNV